MTSIIPHFCCIILFCCIWIGWSEQHKGGIGIMYHDDKTKQTGYSGDSLIIGSTTTYTFTTLNGVDEIIPNNCTRLRNDDYKIQYETKVLKGSSRRFKVGKSAKEFGNKEMNPAEYFIHVKREVWSCIPVIPEEKNEMVRLSLKYFRIVNEMVSFKEIHDIKYYAGVDVSLVNYYENEICVKVVETKCLAQIRDGQFKQVKCEPVIIFNSPENLEPGIPKLVKSFHMSQKLKHVEKNEYTKDAFNTVGDKCIKKISDKGKSLNIGSTGIKTRGLDVLDRKGRRYFYDCYPKQGVSPQLFPPEVYEKIDIEDSESSSYAKITQKYFSKLFTIVDRQVHECKCHTNNRRFYHVVNTMIGKTEIKDVINQYGIFELYTISLPDGGKSIRFTTVEYFHEDTRERAAYENVFYKIHPFEERRSTWINSYMRDPLPDIVFKLDYRTVFRTLINPEGMNLRVGSRIEKTIGQVKQVRCTKKLQNEYLDQFNTVVKLKVVEDDTFHTQVIDDDRISIEYTSKESWLCRNKKGNVEFYRIVNKLKLPAGLPVHEIESFDGVEILVEPLDDGRESVDIVEIKYMDFQNNAVFHEGFMDFLNEETSTSFETSQLPDAIDKNEIFPLIDDMPMRKHNSTDPFVIDGNKNHELIVNAKADEVIDFVVGAQEKEKPSMKSLYICKLEENNGRTLLPYFVVKSESSEIYKLKNADDNKGNSKYFENINNKVWTCKFEDDLFLRVVNKQSLGRNIHGTTHISKISHTDMDKVWFEMTSENNYVVKMEGVRHVKKESSEISPYPNLKDDYLINSGSHYMLFEGKRRTGAWKSGTQELKQETDFKLIKSKIVENIIEMKETDYDLDAGRMYKVPFSRNRIVNRNDPSLRIGSKWSIQESAAYLRCENETFKSQVSDAVKEFLPKVVSIRGGVPSAKDSSKDFIKFRSQRIWDCTSQARRGILRVMNTFDINSVNLGKVNDIFYHYGVTVISEISNTNKMQTLGMMEVKYLDSKTKEVVRFDGEHDLLNRENMRRILKVGQPAIIDVNYNLIDNEKYRSDISSKGVVLEVGQRYESTYDEQANNHARFLRIKCDEVDSNEKVKLFRASELHPEVVVFEKKKKEGRYHPVKMDDKTFQEYFKNQQNEVWLCSEIGPGTFKPIYRVFNRIALSDEQKHSISHVYYYDGVTIYGKQIIEEIKYLSKDGKGKYRVMRFDGFVRTNDKIGRKTMRDYNGQGGDVLEIVHFPLYGKVLHTANIEKDDVTYEVQSHWDVEMRNDDNDVLTCMRKHIPGIDEFGEIKIYSNQKPVHDSLQRWEEIPMLRNVHIEEQDVWHCERNGKLVLKRYVNKLYKTDSTTVRVYYPAGASVEVGEFPHGQEFLQITQVKFLDADAKTLVKYVGKLKLVSEVLPGAENFLINYSFKKESRGLKPSDMPYWSLDFLRMYTIFIFSMNNLPAPMTAVQYNEDRDALQTKMINDRAERVFKIGTAWEEEITESRGEFRCILDEWNSNNIFKYTPRVVEYVDDRLYQLDDIAFHQVFEMEKMEVFICRNDWDEFLRLESVFKGRIPILAVRYGDGVNVAIIKDKQVQITETIYMNIKASNVLKFIKCPGIMTPPQPSCSAKVQKKIRSSMATVGAAVRP